MYWKQLLLLCETILTKKDSVSMHNWMYEDGVLLHGLLQAEQRTNDTRIFPFVKQYADCFVTEDGRIPKIENRPASADCLNNGKIILAVYKRTKEEKYRKSLQYLYSYIQKHPRLTGISAFAHKAIYENQIWLDGLYMMQPLYAGLIPLFGKASDYQDIAAQFDYACRFTYDAETKLFYHAYDHSRKMFWSNDENGHSPCFWGRAMGWFGMALVDTLDAMPQQFQKERLLLTDVLKKLADGICQYQSQNGVWHQITNQSQRNGNYEESSCSCMFAYVLKKGTQNGYLSASYEKYADRAMSGIFKEFVSLDDNGKIHIHQVCQVAGLGPAKKPQRNGSFEYYVNEPIVSDDNKALGPLILALTLYC